MDLSQKPAELIRIDIARIGGASVNAVDARRLYEFLGVGRDFSSWFKDQVERARLVENEHFVLLPKKGEQTGSGGHNRTDFALTVDAAKHIAMMSGTDKGCDVRDYFIACERQLSRLQNIDLDNADDLRFLLGRYTNKVLALQASAEELAPKVAAHDMLAGSSGSMCISDAAKSLSMRPSALFEFLESKRWIRRRGGNWSACQRAIEAGVAEVKTTVIERGRERVVHQQARITAKGLARLAELLAIDPKTLEA